MDEHLTAHERVAPMRPGPSGPLRDVRVLDLTQAIAGPWASMMLADLGADVIKIEPPGGEQQRYTGPFTRDDEMRSYGGGFGSYNRNKRGIVLDLKTDEGKALLLRLVDTADILIENMRAGVLDSLGLSYEVLHARNPKLVYGAIRGFGDPRTGASPYAEWPSYDLIAQAHGGMVAMTGPGPEQRIRSGPFVGDSYAGTVLATAVLAALHHARATGEGQFVDVAMSDAVMALCELGVTRYSYFGDYETPPTGNTNSFLVPFDVFDSADGAIAIGAPTDHHWRIIADVIGLPELGTDERTAKLKNRVKNRAVVTEPLAAWCKAHTNAEILAALGGKAPVGAVNQPGDFFHDPHVAAREMLVAVPQPSGRPVIQTNTPMKMTATPGGIHRRPPMVDEHRAEILAELEARESAG